MKNLLINLLIITFGITNVNAIECTNRLSSRLFQLPKWMMTKPEQTKLHSQCIKESMKAFSGWTSYLTRKRKSQGRPTPGHYLYCEEGIKNRSNSAPCRSEDYINITHNSYNLVLDCLDLKSDDLLPIIAVESGFHMNAVSIFGVDIGVGQLTPPAIQDVNTNWDNYSLVLNSEKNSCQQIISFLNNRNVTLPIEDKLECSLTRLPENPLLNILYTGLFYKTIKMYLSNFYSSTDILQKLENLKGRKLKDLEMYEITKKLATLTYNLGIVGTMNAFTEYVDFLIANEMNVPESFSFVSLERTKNGFAQFLKNRGISSYLFIIEDRLKTLRRRTDKNVSCFKSF